MLRPLSPEHPDDETFDGLLIVRPEGRLYFVNAQNVNPKSSGKKGDGDAGQCGHGFME